MINYWLAVVLIMLALVAGCGLGYWTRAADEEGKTAKSKSNRGGSENQDAFNRGCVYSQNMNRLNQNIFHH